MSEEFVESSVMNSVGRAGWTLHWFHTAKSTNDMARELPAWSAVRADVQTGGRGRYGRSFVSDEGGIWLSAVLPADGGQLRWAGFSLMVGVHLVRMLEDLKIPGIRLRWPNDLMSGTKKLGGLLIEQSSADLLVVGFGLNVTNRPWVTDPKLAPIASSLKNLRNDLPAPETLTVQILDRLSDAHAAMETCGLPAAISELNARWDEPVAVDVLLCDGSHVTGQFTGLDEIGNLRIITPDGARSVVGHQMVEKLTEFH